MSEQVKRPMVTAGALIINEDGKFLLIQSPKWKNQFIIPGGHVEWGEKVEEALVREVKEETGVNITGIEFLKPYEFIFSEDYNKDKHIISLNYLCRTKDSEDSVKLDNHECISYVWLKAEEILKRDDVHHTIKEIVKIYGERPKINQADEYKAGWQRAIADYQNLQKEIAKRQSEWMQMSEQQIIEEFLPVYDHFKTAFLHHPEVGNEQKQIKNWIDGIGHIMKQFKEVLKAHKVEEIKTVGEKFDPRFHESAGEEDGSGTPGTIVREVTGGYKMGERIVKPARVIIHK